MSTAELCCVVKIIILSLLVLLVHESSKPFPGASFFIPGSGCLGAAGVRGASAKDEPGQCHEQIITRVAGAHSHRSLKFSTMLILLHRAPILKPIRSHFSTYSGPYIHSESFFFLLTHYAGLQAGRRESARRSEPCRGAQVELQNVRRTSLWFRVYRV